MNCEGFNYISIKVIQLTVTSNPRRTTISTGIVKMNMESVKYKKFDPIIIMSNAFIYKLF